MVLETAVNGMLGSVLLGTIVYVLDDSSRLDDLLCTVVGSDWHVVAKFLDCGMDEAVRAGACWHAQGTRGEVRGYQNAFGWVVHGSVHQPDVNSSAHPEGIENHMRTVLIAGSVHGPGL